MKIKRKNMIIITEDHGGYEAGFCAICKVRGWISKIKHKKGCPVDSDSEFLIVENFKEEAASIFDKTLRIKEFDIVGFIPREDHPNEPRCGIVEYDSIEFSFVISHEFDCGNSYIVFDGIDPVFHFMLYNDSDGDVDSPMLKYDK